VIKVYVVETNDCSYTYAHVLTWYLYPSFSLFLSLSLLVTIYDKGYYVVTPFERNQNMGTILVNRGWVPRQYVQQNAPWDRPTGLVKLVGIPSKTERKSSDK
jgi:cytochrome oxidase assembly protein ShyY1